MAMTLFILLVLCLYSVEGRESGFAQGINIETVCVDIYKQPAFDHPALKNHKIQMRPSFLSEHSSKRNISSTTEEQWQDFDLKHIINCPTGMVPIQRIHNVSLKSQLENVQPHSPSQPQYHFATFRTKDGDSIYRGAKAAIDLRNPQVGSDQLSLATFSVENGPLGDHDGIGVGWGVYPEIYGDSLTRATGFWRAGGKGCYNVLCPGFVQIHPTLHFGLAYKYVSVPGKRWETDFMIRQDDKTGAWWVFCTKDDIPTGYWPKALFTHLSEGARLVQYGGTTRAGANGLSPPMGSGAWPSTDYGRSCYFKQLRIADSYYQFTYVDSRSMTNYVSSPTCYGFKDYPYQNGDLGKSFSFGGPGGSCGF